MHFHLLCISLLDQDLKHRSILNERSLSEHLVNIIKYYLFLLFLHTTICHTILLLCVIFQILEVIDRFIISQFPGIVADAVTMATVSCVYNYQCGANEWILECTQSLFSWACHIHGRDYISAIDHMCILYSMYSQHQW